MIHFDINVAQLVEGIEEKTGWIYDLLDMRIQISIKLYLVKRQKTDTSYTHTRTHSTYLLFDSTIFISSSLIFPKANIRVHTS